MKIEFDPVKSEKNKQNRGLSFEDVREFNWEEAIYIEDTRILYPERRWVALGFIDERLHVICFTPISEGFELSVFERQISGR